METCGMPVDPKSLTEAIASELDKLGSPGAMSHQERVKIAAATAKPVAEHVNNALTGGGSDPGETPVGIQTYHQPDMPAGTSFTIGSLWYDSDDNNKEYRWNGTRWVSVASVIAGAKILTLGADSQVFKIAQDNTASPASITFTAKLSGSLVGTPVFTVTSGTAVLGGTEAAVRTLAFIDMATDSATVQCSVIDGGVTYTDTVTVVKVSEGTDAINALLTNESVTLPADAGGTVLDYTGASTDIQVFVGATDDTTNWTVSRVDSAGVTSTLAGHTVTAVSLTADAAYVDIVATKSGFPALTRRFSLARSKAGLPGEPGAPGANAKVLTLTSSSQVVQVSKLGALSPSTITLTATPSGALTGAANFTAVAGVATLSPTGNTCSIATSSMSTDVLTVRATITDGADQYTDTVTIVKVREGADTVTAYLTNEAVTLAADNAGNVGSYTGASTDIKILIGAVDDSANWSVTKADSTGVTSSVTGRTVAVTAMSVDTGYVDITAAKSGYPSITKRFSLSKSKTGSAGASASALALTATGQVFQLSKAAVASPTSITFTASLTGGIAGQTVTGWSVSPAGKATLTAGANGNSKVLTYANMATDVDAVTVTATYSSYSDNITVVRVREGADGVAAFLTNENHTLTADKDGVVSNYTGATTDIKIYIGAVDDSANWTVTKVDSTGVTSTLTTRTVSVTAMSVDTGYVDITAAKSGYASITKRFSLSKSKVGATGGTGQAGADALTSYLTLESAAITCDKDGNPLGTSPYVSSTLVVMRGATDDSASWSAVTASPASAAGSVEYTLSGKTISITAFPNTIDNHEITLTVTRSGYPNLTRKLRLSKSKTGATGTAAQTLVLTATAQAFTYDKDGAAAPGTQTINFTALTQNLTGGTLTFTCKRYTSAGAYIDDVVLGTSGSDRTLSNAQFGTAGFATITVTYSGFSGSDKITVVRLKDGATGKDAVIGYLTNESATVATAADGSGGAYNNASVNGTFKVFDGLTDKTGTLGPVTYSVVGAPSWITIATSGAYTVNDPGTATTATLRAVYNSVTIDKVYTIAKSKAGTNGTNAQSLALTATAQSFTYDGSGAAYPLSQTITFKTVKQSLTGTASIVCTRYDNAGSSLGTVTLSGTGDTDRGLSIGQFDNAAYAVVTATLAGLTDQITVVRLTSGSDGKSQVTAYLTNESHTVTTATDGSGGDYSGAYTDVKVFLGTTEDSAQWTLSAAASAGVTTPTINQSTKRVSVSGMSGTDTGYVDITAARTAASYGMGNLLRNSSFETGTGAVADGWSMYNNSGATEPATLSIQASGGVNGGRYQRVSWSVTNTSTKGLNTNNGSGYGVLGGWVPNKTYVLSWYSKGSAGVAGQVMGLGWNHAPVMTWLSNPPLTNAWQRYAVRLTWDADVDTTNGGGSVWLTLSWGAPSTGDLDFDWVQVEETSAPTPYAPMVEAVTKRFSIAKSKTGAQGSPGGPGPTGNTGPRGSMTFYVDMGAGTVWTDAAANNATSGYGGNTLGDTVTEYSNTTNPKWATTKFWAGATNGWTAPGMVVNGNLLVQGSVTSGAINTNEFKVGYNEEDGTKGSGLPVGTPLAGVKIFDASRPLKIGPGGAVVGPYELSAPVVRSLSALGQSSDGKRIFFRGNDSNANKLGTYCPVLMDAAFAFSTPYIVGDRVLWGGNIYICTVAGTSGTPAPTGTGSAIVSGTTTWAYVDTMANQERIMLQHWLAPRALGGTYYLYEFQTWIRPRDINDNLDTLSFLNFVIYDNLGTGGAYRWLYEEKVPVSGRRYGDTTNDNATGNEVQVTWQWFDTNRVASGGVYPIWIKVQAYNAFGTGERVFQMNGATWTNYARSTLPGGADPAPPPTGGDGGGTCTAPETLVTMADGSARPVGNIVAGDWVYAQHEVTGEWGIYQVTYAETFESPRVKVTFNDGRVIVASPQHRMKMGSHWVPVELMRDGMYIDGSSTGVVKSVEPYSKGPVVKLTVDDAHTYVTEGLLSHNVKKL